MEYKIGDKVRVKPVYDGVLPNTVFTVIGRNGTLYKVSSASNDFDADYLILHAHELAPCLKETYGKT